MNTKIETKLLMNKIIGIAFFLLAANAQAGDTTGTVEKLYVHYYNDLVLFRIATDNPGYDTCATSNRYAVETNTPQGKNVLSAILAAKMSGKTIFVKGKGECDVQGSAETVQWLSIE